MNPDWHNLENELYATWVADVRKFATEHGRERFYSLAAAVDPPIGRVDLCANTPLSAQERIEWYVAEYPDDYGPNAGPRQAEQNDEIKWNPGEWLYYNFNNSSAEPWCRFEKFMDEAIESAAGDEDEETQISNRFFSLCYRVLIRTAKEGVYDCLPRTDDFKLLCCHFHDDVAYARLKMEEALVENNATGLRHLFHVEMDSV